MSDHEAAAPQKTLYLVRHGEAKSADDDPSRPLTNAGREAVAKIGRWAAAVGLRVDEIRHSGKLRAQDRMGSRSNESTGPLPVETLSWVTLAASIAGGPIAPSAPMVRT